MLFCLLEFDNLHLIRLILRHLLLKAKADEGFPLRGSCHEVTDEVGKKSVKIQFNRLYPALQILSVHCLPCGRLSSRQAALHRGINKNRCSACSSQDSTIQVCRSLAQRRFPQAFSKEPIRDLSLCIREAQTDPQDKFPLCRGRLKSCGKTRQNRLPCRRQVQK